MSAIYARDLKLFEFNKDYSKKANREQHVKSHKAEIKKGGIKKYHLKKLFRT